MFEPGLLRLLELVLGLDLRVREASSASFSFAVFARVTPPRDVDERKRSAGCG